MGKYGINYNMQYLEIIMSFIIGGIVAILLAFVFSLKNKGFIRMLINIAAGCISLVVLNFLGIGGFKVNPLSAFLVGVCGVPGLAVIFLIMTFA